MKPLESEEYTDVVELCAILQCLGFNVKSLNMSDANMSQEGGTKTIVINCQSSGLHVVLEHGSAACTCPAASLQNSGFWQVEAVSGGRQIDKEYGSALLGSFPKSFKERLTKDLQVLIKGIKQHNECTTDLEQPGPNISNSVEVANRSASMVDVKTPPEKRLVQKVITPTRYRSLDTLTANKESAQELPPPGHLVAKQPLPPGSDTSADDVHITDVAKRSMCRRQSTYTVASTPGSGKLRNKTSSPIQQSQTSLLENLISAEKDAENLRYTLSNIIQSFAEDNNDSSIVSLALDVSKISVLKCADSKAQFASSPNLSGLHTLHEDGLTKLKRFESASTSNLSPSRATPKDCGSKFTSKLKRLSPNFFKRNNDKSEKPTANDSKNKFGSGLIKPRIVTPVQMPRVNSKSSPNLSGTKKKYSHIKSTIPRPSAAPRKD